MSMNFDDRDLEFIRQTLAAVDPELTFSRYELREDIAVFETALDNRAIFERLVSEDDILVRISPLLFFTILLRRVWRDLEGQHFTVEQRSRQKVHLFDAGQVVQLLAEPPVREYLARMLASFIRVETVTMLVQVRKGVWRDSVRGYRIHEFDLEGMMRYSRTLDEAFRFAPYKRIGDVCLFIAGMFPEYIKSQHRYSHSGQVRPGIRARLYQKLEDYESYGRAFYQMAAEHEQARRQGLRPVLVTLSENFILAEKPLAFLSRHYLHFNRSSLFGM